MISFPQASDWQKSLGATTCALGFLGLAGIAAPTSSAQPPHPQPMTTEDQLALMDARLRQLEMANAVLIDELRAARAETRPPAAAPAPAPIAPRPVVDRSRATLIDTAPPPAKPVSGLRPRQSADENFVGVVPEYGYVILDAAEDVNTKPLVQLQARQKGILTQAVTFSGAITGLLNYQRSNRDDKFGYLMRNPTSNNQIGRDVSEAVIHSAQLSATAKLSESLTGYIELLYNPQQSFGAGTITDLNRNQMELRRAWLLFGDLDRYPVYAALGKMDTPFGLQDTVSPFTNSSNWHAFSGLAYGATLGYYSNGFHLRAMAIQGGAQFRAHNSPVQDTAVPSRINNFALDARYHGRFGDSLNYLIGASYQHGSAYCQDYPVVHFNPCQDNNPAWAAYGRVDYGALRLLAEYAETVDDWPGTQVPDPTNTLSQFDAAKARAWTVGGRYDLDLLAAAPLTASLEFSRFLAGDEGAPWENQDQLVAGLSWFPSPSVNVFGEYVHVDGFAPLNFLSGGNFPDGSTWSDADAKTDVFLLGVQAAF